MRKLIVATLREILCASMSLDDGLSAIQNISIGHTEESDIPYDIARAIEEILLRRPGLASAKLMELTVRLSSDPDRTLPKMLMLLDTRSNTAYRRGECEILPDIQALPQLLDILGELSSAVMDGLSLNLRPLIPFLADEMLMTLTSIVDRGHPASTRLAVRETHHLASILVDRGFYECAELLLEALVRVAAEVQDERLYFEVAIDHAVVLTETGLYKQARTILEDLERRVKENSDVAAQAAVALQIAVNETRDDTVDHTTARASADRAVELHRLAVEQGRMAPDELAVAELTVGVNILANGWREAVPQAMERLEAGLAVYEEMDSLTQRQASHCFKVLAGLGFAHGLLSDHDNVTLSIRYLRRAEALLRESVKPEEDITEKIAACEHCIGWVCLCSESDEHWELGIDAFRKATELRRALVGEGRLSWLALLGSELGHALSLIRTAGRMDEGLQERLVRIMHQYTLLFPTDLRAFEEAAIATYNIVWLASRHGAELSQELLRLLEDIDRMLTDATPVEDSVFVRGISLLMPYLKSDWRALRYRAEALLHAGGPLRDVVLLMSTLAKMRIALDYMTLESITQVITGHDGQLDGTDELMARYWDGQVVLARAVAAFYGNKDYTTLAQGLYDAAVMLRGVLHATTDFEEAAEFVRATAGSLAGVLLRFATALEKTYGARIEKSTPDITPADLEDTGFNFILSEDWIGLLKITNAYLEMVERAELAQAMPYLNAVFSNIASALRMMDRIAMVDRRMLNRLGEEMNRRYYLRR